MSDNRIIPLTPANEKNSTTPTTAQPAAGAVLPQPIVLVLTVLVAVAGVLPMIPGLPPVVTAVAGVVVAVGAALGIASPGIRRKVE